ncbi:MAG: ABC transporter substrate-binding protein [Minisyncoccota bacterium]
MLQRIFSTVRSLFYAFIRMLGKRFDLIEDARFSRAFSTLTKIERRIFATFATIFIISTVLLLEMVNVAFLVKVPAHRGGIVEAAVGAPKFINPLLATSDTDRDLTALVYSGLMRRDQSGTLIPDLAQSYTISPDGLTYTFTLRPHTMFQDNSPLTASDVAFTIARAKESSIRGDIRGRWDGVSVATPDQRTIIFTLKRPYVSFLDNTTIGILPMHLWGKVATDAFITSDFNTDPIGSGPYQVHVINRSNDGKAITSYELSAFEKFTLGAPYLQTLTFSFYPDEDAELKALQNGSVQSIASLSPQSAAHVRGGEEIALYPEQRLYGVFFNQTQNPVFSDPVVRTVLGKIIDRPTMVHTVFSGYAVPLSKPIPPGIVGYVPETPQSLRPQPIAEAQAALAKDGWKLDPAKNVLTKKNKKVTVELRFTLATRNIPELKQIAEILKATWEQAGIRVDIAYYDEGDLRETIIRPRKYDALLFGGVFPAESALYSFWHSSQRNDPGYNVSMYANPKTDKILEKIFSTASLSDRIAEYATFDQEIARDAPAVFLYAPDFMYAIPSDLHGIIPGTITDSPDRFANVYQWYRETDSVWKIFAQ